jgi:hypothetical protein
VPNRLNSLLALLAILLAAAGLTWGGLHYWRSIHDLDAVRLSETLPRESGAILYIDWAALRSTGLMTSLAKSKAAEEPDYKQFVNETGFDYTRDLDALAASFVNGDLFAAIRGKFEWKRLTAYASAHGGSCENDLCSLPATQPGRFISFYPLKSNVLAMAASRDPHGANHIDPPHGAPVFHAGAPVALSAPGFEFEAGKGLPPGSQAFLSPLAKSTRSSFYAQAGKDQNFELRLEAECPSPKVAEELAKQLQQTTELLRSMLARDKMKPREDDLSGLLVSGKFESKETHATGTWPLNRNFVEFLLSGEPK